MISYRTAMVGSLLTKRRGSHFVQYFLQGLAIGVGFFAPLAGNAQSYIMNAGGAGSTIRSTTGLGSNSPQTVVVYVINIVLGVLALIAVVLVIIAGFRWMMSGGNEEKVTEAKNMLRAAIIGLGIIMAAWGISVYVISIFARATGTTTT